MRDDQRARIRSLAEELREMAGRASHDWAEGVGGNVTMGWEASHDLASLSLSLLTAHDALLARVRALTAERDARDAALANLRGAIDDALDATRLTLATTCISALAARTTERDELKALYEAGCASWNPVYEIQATKLCEAEARAERFEAENKNLREQELWSRKRGDEEFNRAERLAAALREARSDLETPGYAEYRVDAALETIDAALASVERKEAR